MKIRYETTMEDIVAWNLFFNKHSPTVQRLVLRTRIVWSIVCYILGLVECWLLAVGRMPLPTMLVLALILPAFYLARARLTYEKQVRKLTLKLYSEGENKGMVGPHELTVSEEGLTSKTPYSEGKYSWAALERIESTEDATYLYVGATSAFVIPHDAITEGDFRAFMAQIGQHYHPEKRLADKAIL